jgi:hypothetical protein
MKLRVWLVMLVALGPQLLLAYFLPTSDPLEMVVRVFGWAGWGWLVGTWAAKRVIAKRDRRP